MKIRYLESKRHDYVGKYISILIRNQASNEMKFDPKDMQLLYLMWLKYNFVTPFYTCKFHGQCLE